MSKCRKMKQNIFFRIHTWGNTYFKEKLGNNMKFRKMWGKCHCGPQGLEVSPNALVYRVVRTGVMGSY